MRNEMAEHFNVIRIFTWADFHAMLHYRYCCYLLMTCMGENLAWDRLDLSDYLSVYAATLDLYCMDVARGISFHDVAT